MDSQTDVLPKTKEVARCPRCREPLGTCTDWCGTCGLDITPINWLKEISKTVIVVAAMTAGHLVGLGLLFYLRMPIEALPAASPILSLLLSAAVQNDRTLRFHTVAAHLGLAANGIAMPMFFVLARLWAV